MQNIFEILEQKLWPPKNYSPAYIKGFDHWFSPENLNRIDKVLETIKKETNGKKCLDIGFGNPIALERELKIFPQCFGLYITLDEVSHKGVSGSIISSGNCYPIPYDAEEFDLVSAYAFLHIIPDIPEFYKEAFRVLKMGGHLYTDGDRNILITKIIRKLRMIQCRTTGNKSMFEHWKGILNIKENFHQEGIDYIKLKKILKEIGFSKVIITPWFSAKPDYQNKVIYRILIKLLSFFNAKFLFTHIQIIAIK